VILKDDDGDLYLTLDWKSSPRRVRGINAYEEERRAQGRKSTKEYESLDDGALEEVLLSGGATLIRVSNTFGTLGDSNSGEALEDSEAQDPKKNQNRVSRFGRDPIRRFLGEIHADFVVYTDALRKLGVEHPSDIATLRLSEKDLLRVRIKVLHGRKIISTSKAHQNLRSRLRNTNEKDMARVWQLGHSLVDLEFFGKFFSSSSSSSPAGVQGTPVR